MSEWLDSRRLIGPNIEWERPGALLEVAGLGNEFAARLERWTHHARTLMDRLGWREEGLRLRRFDGGALLILSAPVNALYTATEVNEDAWTLSKDPSSVVSEAVVKRLQQALNEEADPAAMAIFQAASKHGKTCLVDENGVSVGMGARGAHWAAQDLPNVAQLDWSRFDDVPTVLVTGTNGKTTTVRLLAAMSRAGGICPGLSSTDWIQVGDDILDHGDFSGPAGARRVLRDPRTQLAILETARGGLLRRGLALQTARAAIVTNVTEDHLGDGGIETVDDLAAVKFMVTRVLGDHGVAVLNADDNRCRAHGRTLSGPVSWFSLSPPDNDCGDDWYWIENRMLMRRLGGEIRHIIPVAEAPITLGGGARHNVANALAASAAAEALGLSLEAVVKALRSFGQNIDDNPGRANLLEIGGVKILLDFAHNPEGMQAMFDAGRALGASRTGVVFGQAGDRSNQAIRDLTNAVVDSGADFVVIKEMDEYRRGRQPGEVRGIIRKTLAARGIDGDRVADAELEPDAAALAFRWAHPGDLLMLFVHSGRDEVLDRLKHDALLR